MDAAHKSERKFPAYATDQLRAAYATASRQGEGERCEALMNEIARREASTSCITDYEAWLRNLAAKGGKGAVDNIDARSLGRIADLLARKAAQLETEREETQSWCLRATEYRERMEKAEAALDKAWERVNALGGPYFDRDWDHVDRARMDGRNTAINDALGIIEDLGGVDPLRRKADNGQFGVGA